MAGNVEKWWYRSYLSPEVLIGFEGYRYSSVDNSPLSRYVMHPFWNKVVLYCPRWIAPNVLTLAGFGLYFLQFLLFAVYDYDFSASALSSENPIPRWVWWAAAGLLFASHTLDGIDGKQARRTGTSGPMGELLDHGLDAWSTVFIATALYSIFGRNLDGYSVSPLRNYAIVWTLFVTFHLSHWEKYNTGILYLPWGYDFSMFFCTILLAITGIFGADFVKIDGFLKPSNILEGSVYFGSLIGVLPVSLYHVWMSYARGTGKMRSCTENLRPFVPLVGAGLVCYVWVLGSPNGILETDPRCFYFMSGTLYANISCRLIVSQMSDTRAEAGNPLLWPLTLLVLVITIFSPSPAVELWALYGYFSFIFVAHLHYGVCVMSQMCHHFGIRPLTISNNTNSNKTTNEVDSDRKGEDEAEKRLIDQNSDDGDDNDDDPEDKIFSV